MRELLYDFNSDKIRPSAQLELLNLLRLLEENPRINLELSSHTDSRGVDAYNLDLSQGLVIYLGKASFGPASIYELPTKDSQIISTVPSGGEMYVFPVFRKDFLLVGTNNLRPLGYVNVGDIQFSAADRLGKIKEVSKANFPDISEFE